MYLINKRPKYFGFFDFFKLSLVCLVFDFTTMLVIEQFTSLSGVVLLVLESVIFTLSFSTAYYLIYYRPLHHSFQNSLELLNEFETVLRTTSDGFWITDIEHNGRILFVNDAYCEMIGYTRQDLLQMNIRDIDCNESLEEMKNHFQRIIEKRHDRFVSTHMTKSGEKIEVEVSVTFLNINQGRFYVFLKNITQEQQLKRNMLGQNEKLYEIAFLQSHQVRAPIVRLLGLINLINYEEFNDPENKEIIHALKDSTVNFDEIIREIINKTNDLYQLKQENDSKQ